MSQKKTAYPHKSWESKTPKTILSGKAEASRTEPRKQNKKLDGTNTFDRNRTARAAK